MILMFSCSIALADKIEIPFQCFPKEIQKSFKQYGIKLDLSGNDRSQDSWGFIQNEGSRYNLFSYNLLTIKELELVGKIIVENLNENSRPNARK